MQPSDPSTELVRQQLGRILSSFGFVRNERLARFLHFVVEQQLQGKSDQIKESVIGVEVFGRSPDYNPRRDPVVRMEASKLRARLAEYYAGQGAGDPVIIELPKGGYTPLVFSRDTMGTEARSDTKQRLPRRRRYLIAEVGAFVVIVAVAALWSRQHQKEDIAIAVLPIENLSADPANEYFADGLTGELIRDLELIEGLAVRSRASSFALKGQRRNVREAGKQLAADYILDASVQRNGEHLRVTAQLVRVRDDFVLWSGKFDDLGLADVFAIQDEIAQGIVNKLRLNLGRGRRRYEASVEAYDLYFRARDSQKGAARIDLFQQAIVKDSSFAPAYAGLASAYAARSVQFPLAHPSDELANMRAAAQRAIDLDPFLTEAHRALAMAYARDGQWKEAEKEFREAIRLSPHDSANYDDFVYDVLQVLGRHDEAIQQLRTAQKLDPLYLHFERSLGLVLISANRYDEAFEHCQKIPDEQTPVKAQCLARARFFQGKSAEAIRILESKPRSNPLMRGFLGYSYARSARIEEAKRMAAVAASPNEKALIYAGLGDREGTLAALDQMAAETGPIRVGEFVNYPELAFLRNDPGMKALKKKVGLPE